MPRGRDQTGIAQGVRQQRDASGGDRLHDTHPKELVISTADDDVGLAEQISIVRGFEGPERHEILGEPALSRSAR